MKKDFHAMTITDDVNEALESNNLFNFVIGSNGLFEIVKERHFTYTIRRKTNLPVNFTEEKPFSFSGNNFLLSKNGVRVHNGKCYVQQTKFPLLPQKVTTFFDYKLPKIPYTIFLKIFWFFKIIWKVTDAEVMLEVYFNPNTQEYFVHCPKQTISKYRVFYHYEDIPNMIKIMEIHSHHSMSSNFTTIDDNDENKIGTVYGVVGNFKKDSAICSMKLRVANKGSFKYLNFGDIFEIPTEKADIQTLKKLFREDYKNWKEKLIVK